AVELALAWWQFTSASVRARIALGLRVAMAALLVLALLGVGPPQIVNRQATVFVADTSASTQSLQPAMAAFIQQATATKGPDDTYAVVSTASSANLNHSVSSVPL